MKKVNNMTRNYTIGPYGVIIPPEELDTCPCCGGDADFHVGIELYQIKSVKCSINLIGTNDKALCRAWNKRHKRQQVAEPKKDVKK